MSSWFVFKALALIKFIILIHVDITTFTKFGKVRDANAWRCKKQWDIRILGTSFFINAVKPDVFPSIAGAPCVHKLPSLFFHSMSCFSKKPFIKSKTSAAFVVPKSELQKRNFMWFQNVHIVRIPKAGYIVIRLCSRPVACWTDMVKNLVPQWFAKETASTFFLWSLPHTSSTMSSTQGSTRFLQ